MCNVDPRGLPGITHDFLWNLMALNVSHWRPMGHVRICDSIGKRRTQNSILFGSIWYKYNGIGWRCGPNKMLPCFSEVKLGSNRCPWSFIRSNLLGQLLSWADCIGILLIYSAPHGNCCVTLGLWNRFHRNSIGSLELAAAFNRT